MINKQMRELYEQNKVRDEEDPSAVQKMWDKQIEVLCANLEDTIEYLKTAPEEELFYVGEVFEDIASYWQSEELIKVMEDAANRCSKELRDSLYIDIKYAKMEMKQ